MAPSRLPLAFIAEWSAALVALVIAVMVFRQTYETTVLTITLAAAPLLVWIVVQDLRSFTIPDGAVVAVALLALAVRVSAGDPALVLVLDVLLTGGLLLAFREIYYRRRGFDGLGLGDVKLAAAGGLLIGAVGFAWALLAASLVAIAAVGVVHQFARKPAPMAAQKLAFGAVLAPAVYLAWLVQAWPILLPAGS